MTFIDEAVIQVVAGDGGNGCIAFRREKFVPKGGPAGGDGGDGGSVYLLGDRNLNTLYHLRHQPRLAAQKGRHGEGSNKTGKRGQDLEVHVPLGTVCRDGAAGQILGEVVAHGERLLVASGGAGGRGNARFATANRRAPRYAEEGRAGESRELRLELKLLADVGLVGLPNAGKSTLVSAISAARPKIASYPFTTLAPQLGVVATGEISEPFVIADLPGLIEGAAQGAGLGHQFLRHVERCRVLVHLVDLSDWQSATAATAGESSDGTSTDGRPADGRRASVVEELESVEAELRAFDPSLMGRGRLIVGSKVDSVSAERRSALRRAAEGRGLPYLEISSVSRRGLEELVHEIRALLRSAASSEDEVEVEPTAAGPTP
ncbi:MAG: GTPase ObgE [Holophagales bacterium]|nr:GTPase ObgE [Holophagales bacterium]